MKITYYTNGMIEILIMKDDDGQIIKKGLYTIGNCIIDMLYGDPIIYSHSVLGIEPQFKKQTTQLLEECSDHLHNNIPRIIEKEFGFIFEQKYIFQNVFIENKLCRIYTINDFYSFICFLLAQIYTRKLMYKRCEYCKRLFATKYAKAKYCKRVATKNGKTCGYASSLKKKHNA